LIDIFLASLQDKAAAGEAGDYTIRNFGNKVDLVADNSAQ